MYYKRQDSTVAVVAFEAYMLDKRIQEDGKGVYCNSIQCPGAIR